MKKYLNVAFGYSLAAMACGVFYREFTKWNRYTGVTALGKVHTHLFLLGMFVFLFVALFSAQQGLETQRSFRAFFVVYNIGVPFLALMMLVRGVCQVLGIALSAGADAAISGLAGLAHILTGTGLVLLFVALRKAAKH